MATIDADYRSVPATVRESDSDLIAARPGYRFNLTMTAIYLLGIYTEFHIYANGVLVVPYAVANAAGLMLLVYNFRRIAIPGDRLLLMMFALNCLLLVGFMFNVNDDISDRLHGIAQLDLSLVGGLGIISALVSLGPGPLACLFTGIGYAILGISVFEIYLGGHDLVVAANHLIYAWRPDEFYQSNARDLDLWGTIRPLAFATEPSLAAIWGTVYFALGTLLMPVGSTKAIVRLTIFTAALLVVSHSFSVVFIYIGCTVYLVLDSRYRGMLIQVVAGAVALLLPIVLATSVSSDIVNYSQDASFFARLIAPPLVTVNVLEQHPLIGSGVGSLRSLLPIIQEVWGRGGMYSLYPFTRQWPAEDLVTSSFFLFWTYLGVVGGIVALILLRNMVRMFGTVRFAIAFIPVALCWQDVGGLVDARTWAFFYMIMAVDILRHQTSHAPRSGMQELRPSRQPTASGA